MWYFLVAIVLVYAAQASDPMKAPEITKSNEYTLVEADVRNIIFVGRSRVGKTTLISVLKDKDHSPKKVTQIVHGTVNTELRAFTMSSKIDNMNLHFNIMDTPGLFEYSMSLDDKRSNEIIMDTITKCIDLEITKVHHVYFVMTIQDGLNQQDIEAFNLFTQLFVGAASKISIIISRAQELTPEEESEYVEQFKTVPALQKMYNEIEGRIFFLGAAQKSRFVNMEYIQDNVYRQRNALFKHIIAQDSTFNVKRLALYQNNVDFLKRIKEKLKGTCDSIYTSECDDLTKFDKFIERYQPKFDDENDNQDEVKQSEDGDPEFKADL